MHARSWYFAHSLVLVWSPQTQAERCNTCEGRFVDGDDVADDAVLLQMRATPLWRNSHDNGKHLHQNMKWSSENARRPWTYSGRAPPNHQKTVKATAAVPAKVDTHV